LPYYKIAFSRHERLLVTSTGLLVLPCDPIRTASTKEDH
jgi:hypothetical protein